MTPITVIYSTESKDIAKCTKGNDKSRVWSHQRI